MCFIVIIQNYGWSENILIPKKSDKLSTCANSVYEVIFPLSFIAWVLRYSGGNNEHYEKETMAVIYLDFSFPGQETTATMLIFALIRLCQHSELIQRSDTTTTTFLEEC